MTLPFAGAALRLSPSDISAAAVSMGCEEAAIRAVLTVEAGGSGFLADGSGRMRILFEAHHFSQATGGAYDATHPNISSPVQNWHLYKGGAAEYDRLGEAAALNRSAAIASASWGLFQILGSNYAACGSSSPEAFQVRLASSEAQHLAAFMAFCRAGSGALRTALCNRDWASFARLYNGPLYETNHYDAKLAAAYTVNLAGAPAPVISPSKQFPGGAVVSMLRLGAEGPAVSLLQAALVRRGFMSGTADGIFGHVTELAVMRAQEAAGLQIDGVAGPATAAAIGLVSGYGSP